MSSEEDMLDEIKLKVYNLLARASRPMPVQGIADEIMKDYDYTLIYLTRMGEQWHLRFHDLEDGSQAVELVAVSRPH